MPDLYDTCVFIDYWKGDPNAITLIQAVMNQPKSASNSPLSVVELWQYNRLGRQEEIEYMALTQFYLEQAPFTAPMAMKAGQWLRSYSRNQRRRLAADAMVAATADNRGECIRTRNAKDIQKFYSNVQTY